MLSYAQYIHKQIYLSREREREILALFVRLLYIKSFDL